MSESTEFKWGEADVFPSVRAVAVYTNPAVDVVIRQEAGPYDDEDSVVVVPRAMVSKLIDALVVEIDE